MRARLDPAATRTLVALGLEAAIGYPSAAPPHPVTWIGAALDGLERRWNGVERSEEERRWLGVLCMGLVGGAAAGAGLLVQRLTTGRRLGPAALALAASVGLAQRSLLQHVEAVARALEADDLPAARTAVGRIVGRDVAALDASGVAGAALESLAESFNDAVVAPAFWLRLAGLPGLYGYKAFNTADSMIGHREPRWRAFGWAAARGDDLLNLAPARLAGLLIALAGSGGFGVMRRDAPRHASPNAGWPEAAMAGALRVRLGGPAAYDGSMVERPWFGDGRPPSPGDLRRGLDVYRRACALLWLAVALGGLRWRP